MRTADETTHDLLRFHNNDPEIELAHERLRSLYKRRGYTYYEILGSKTYESVKYILREVNNGSGRIDIIDIDSNDVHILQ